MTNREKIVARIGLLLALATKNDNPHEAQSAMEKARELMREYQVSQTDAERMNDNGIGEEDLRTAVRRPPIWQSRLVARICPKLGCEAIRVPGVNTTDGKAKFVIVGAKVDRMFAHYLLKSLTVQINQMAQHKRKEWRKSKRKRTRLQAYREGLVIGVLIRVEELLETHKDGIRYSPGLMRVGDLEKVNKWIDQHYQTKRKQIKQRRHKDVAQGYADSKRLTVARAVSASRPDNRMIEGSSNQQ